jgi:hypothetical protein
MPRTMLQLRIDALSQHLDQAEDPSGWKQLLELPKFNVDDKLWLFAIEKIHAEAAELKEELATLNQELQGNGKTESEGWAAYARVQAASEDIFRECLDLLGGLALRDRIQDERICRIADDYIKELANDTGRSQSFSIPGLEVRLSSTLRRVVTMQFPEWTLWTLPLVAHEYAHVVIEESGLRTFADTLTQERAADPANRDGAHRRVRIALADALATLLAGPAYAYAALLLRLNPLRAPAGEVSDQERATTILAVLREMNTGPATDPPPHGKIVDRLETYWRESVSAALGPADEPPAEGVLLLDPDRVRKAFRKYIPAHKTALYEGRHSNRAISLSDAWQEQMKGGGALTAPVPGDREHIREALNAVWRARVAATSELEPPQAAEAHQRVKMLEAVGLEFCDLIITARDEERPVDTHLGRAPKRAGGPP